MHPESRSGGRSGYRGRRAIDERSEVCGNNNKLRFGEDGGRSEIEFVQAACVTSIGGPVNCAALPAFLAEGDEAVDIATAGVEQGIRKGDVFRRIKPGKPASRVERDTDAIRLFTKEIVFADGS